MICGAGTAVFNLPYSSGLPTDSIIPSSDKAGVFPSFSDATTFLASSFSSSSYETFHMASSPSFPPSGIFSQLSTLPPLPVKATLWSLPNRLHFYALNLFSFAYMLSGIELAQYCIPSFSSSLVVMFLEHLVWRTFLADKSTFLQCGAKIMILHVR